MYSDRHFKYSFQIQLKIFSFMQLSSVGSAVVLYYSSLQDHRAFTVVSLLINAVTVNVNSLSSNSPCQ